MTIISIAASGVVSALIAYRLNATREHVFFMRQKAEELYLALERYDRSLGSHFITYYGLLKNEISYNELFEIHKKNRVDSGSGDSLDTATMLINVYFVGLKSHLDAYISARTNIRNILADHNRAYKKGETDGSPWYQLFHRALLEFEGIAVAFKQAILDEAMALAPAERLWPQSLTIRALREKGKAFLRQN